jgi:hypothetical protein
MSNTFSLIETVRSSAGLLDTNKLSPTQRRRLNLIVIDGLSRSQVAFKENVAPKTIGNTIKELAFKVESALDNIG